MKIIICGSRSITDYNIVLDAIKKSNTHKKATLIVSGGAKGVDKLGERYAKENGIKYQVFQALWHDLKAPGAIVDVRPGDDEGYYNARAGLDRNIKMGDFADACLAIWDGVSSGTAHMINYMKKLGKPVYIYKVENVVS